MENINISASSVEEFKEAEKLLRKLPDSISSQIKSAKFGGVGLECIIRYNFTEYGYSNI